MSEITELFCDHCPHSVTIGWVGQGWNRTIALCRECDRWFFICPAPGETLNQSHHPYWIIVRGKQWVEVTSKKGRIKKQVSQEDWVDSGIRVPVQEEAILEGEKIRILYDLVFDQVHCPHCNAKGSLMEYQKYYHLCPVCNIGTLR